MAMVIRGLAATMLLGLTLNCAGAQIGVDPSDEKQIDKLLKGLKEENEVDRVSAAQGLASRPLPQDAAKPLLVALKDESLAVRGWAAIALLRADQSQAKLAFTALTPLFDKPDLALWHVSWALTFQYIKPTKKETVAGLIKLARHKNPSASVAGCLGLDNLGAEAKEAVELLTDSVDDTNAKVRLRCALALGRIDTAKLPRVVPILEAGLKEMDVEDRLFAGEALVALDPKLKTKVIAALAPGMRAPDGKARLRIAAVILELDPTQTKFILPFLTSSLKDQDKDVRLKAISLLAERGPGAASAETNLRDCLKDEDAEVGAEAAEALMRVRPERAGDFFTPLVQLRDTQEKTALAPLLELIEKQDELSAKEDPKILTKTIVSRIETKLERKNGYLMQLSAVVRVPGLGQRAKEAVPALVTLLDDPRPVMNSQAAYLLGKQGSDARAAVAPLYKLYRSSAPLDVRLAAARALWLIAPTEAKKAGVPDEAGVGKPDQ